MIKFFILLVYKERALYFMIRPTSFGKPYRPISATKPVRSVQSPVRIQQAGTAYSTCDQIQISQKGSFQSRLAESAAEISRETASVSSQRLQDLKEQIANGTYQVSAADLADTMLSRVTLGKEDYHG
jgi:flagellar biosynthesis anti-sigma factor FlgM